MRIDLVVPSGIKQIKLAYDLGINAFDTANVYSNGLSEVILGKAIKQHKLPRDEIVVMTKLYMPLNPQTLAPSLMHVGSEGWNKKRLVNQYGLGRKVRLIARLRESV